MGARFIKQRLLPAIFVVAAVCALTRPAILDAHDPVGTRVTWTGDVERIFRARCVGCHSAGSIDPIPLTTYDEVQPWASAIRQQVLSRRMPIWNAARGFGEFLNDPSLSPFEIQLITAWANAGAPRGDDTERGSSPQAEPASPHPTPQPAKSRALPLECGTQPLSGRLLGLKPELEQGGSVTVTALLPDGRSEIVAWIRDYDPRYPTTYWLRTPIGLPLGSRLALVPTGQCKLTATLAR